MRQVKPLLFALVIATLAATVVASAYSPLYIDFWSRHQTAQMMATYCGQPTVYLMARLLGLFGVDTSTSTFPLVIGAFGQWFLAAYLVGGILFRDAPAKGSRGGRKG